MQMGCDGLRPAFHEASFLKTPDVDAFLGAALFSTGFLGAGFLTAALFVGA